MRRNALPGRRGPGLRWRPSVNRRKRTRIDGINAANLRQAHAAIESGATIGKIVLAGFRAGINTEAGSRTACRPAGDPVPGPASP
ncbi:MAG TPA: hypothetical protein VGD43_11210, partial [Micromonospora sp.]